MTHTPIITIDGPSGSGKGTIAQKLAQHFHWHLLDSGAIYRTAALAAQQNNIDFSDHQALVNFIKQIVIKMIPQANDNLLISYNDNDVTTQIRTEDCAKLASQIASLAEVRQALFQLQLDFCCPPGLVADGRDMGTIVFPDSALKIFLTASIEKRANRRFLQLQKKNNDVSLATCVDFFRQRDHQDTSRKIAALKPADDAIVIDNSELGITDTLKLILYRAAAIFN